MPYFSESDINEAKRRVREMQSRANHYVSEEPKSEERKQENNSFQNGFPPPSNLGEGEREKEKNNENRDNSEQGSLLDLFGGGDKSQLIILALIFVLSREGADNMLILALLYLLL